jgi:hypothetical protein
VSRAKKLTAEVLGRVPVLIEQGLVAAQIADAIGCTLGTLRVRCSQAGVSLRRKNGDKPKITADKCVSGSGTLSRGSEAEVSSNAPGAKSTMRPCPSGSVRIPPDLSPRAAPMALMLERTTADQLRRRAALKGVSAATFISMLLEVIVRDRLYDAVLDGNDQAEVMRSGIDHIAR